MKQVTVRIPDIGHERLRRLCGRYGVSGQAVFEAALAISLEDELDPDRSEGQLAIWAVARDLEGSGALWGGPARKKLAIRMEDCLFARFDDACKRFGVSHNAALALVVMPWPAGHAEVSERYRAENLHRIVDRAREIDFVRRNRRLTGPAVTP